jgi:hypothetical protein
LNQIYLFIKKTKIMKKVSLFLGMVLAASFAIAQVNEDNDATITQYGSNIGIINQTGSHNDGVITQGTESTPITTMYSNGTNDWKRGAYVDQVGNHNDAEIIMTKSSAGASIDQKGGDYNWAKQDLNSGSMYTTSWTRMGADIDQTGNHNFANQKTLSSFGTYGVQGIMIVQTGDYNKADQLSIGGMANVTEITQIGSNNNNSTESLNTYDVSKTTLADPLLLTWAHKPAGDFTQYANQNKGTTHIYVQGDNNNTFQYQEYTSWGGGEGDNDAMIDLYGSGNDVAQGQLGEFNSSDIDIDGSNNVVTSSQLGDSNIVNIDLVGGSNNCVVGVQQIGDLHSATVYQSGASNFAKIVQQ